MANKTNVQRIKEGEYDKCTLRLSLYYDWMIIDRQVKLYAFTLKNYPKIKAKPVKAIFWWSYYKKHLIFTIEGQGRDLAEYLKDERQDHSFYKVHTTIVKTGRQ